MNTSTRAPILISALAAIACFPIVASAQVPATAAPACPVRYEPMDSGLCYNKTSGDVVLAEVPAASRVFTSARCPTGYTVLAETLCFSGNTGDIVFAEDRTGITIQAKR